VITDLPVILGGRPILEKETPLTRPTTDTGEALEKSFTNILQSGQLTNGQHVAAFEREVAEFLGAGYVVAVANCTTGLLMVLRCLGLSGSVVLPSFTFMASGHAVLWNGLSPRFADVGRESFTMRADDAAKACAADTAALLAVHTFGAPCDVTALQAETTSRGIPLIVDAAHGFGGRYTDGTRIGTKGTAEVFSLSPTKPFSTGEGGLIATNDADLARELVLARNYGNPGSYDSTLLGLNGRMAEVSALIGRHNLPLLDRWLDRRRHLVGRYRSELSDILGLTFQQIPGGATSVFKDLCVLIEPKAFGLRRDELAQALQYERVPSRAYFDPPLHRQTVYRPFRPPAARLTTTDWLSKRALTLPLYAHMQHNVVEQVCTAIRRIARHADRVAEALEARSSTPIPT
jgi:dTDP-4-amino-4,6-dideoxygalactose transaminase